MRIFSAVCLVALGAINLPAAEITAPVDVPVRHDHGRMLLTASINESEKLTFLLDSACTIPTLHPSVIDQLGVSPSGRVRINGIAGEERAPTFRGLVFQFDGAKYAPRRVAAIPSERNESRRRRDGVIGSGFFETFVVEADPQTNILRLHPPSTFSYTGTGEIIPFRFHEEIPVIKAAIVFPDKTIEGEFEIDTGCDSGVCLGAPFIREHKLLNLIEGRDSEKFGIGGSVETKSIRLPAFRMGKLELEKAQADLFLDASPVDPPMAGHIGMGVLSQFRVIYDYPRKRMILERMKDQ